MEEFTEQEKRQIYTACWNQRAKLEELRKQQLQQKNVAINNSTTKRIELLDSIISKLEP